MTNEYILLTKINITGIEHRISIQFDLFPIQNLYILSYQVLLLFYIQCHLLFNAVLRVVEGADPYESNATFIAWTLRPIFSELFYLTSHARIRINTGFYSR